MLFWHAWGQQSHGDEQHWGVENLFYSHEEAQVSQTQIEQNDQQCSRTGEHQPCVTSTTGFTSLYHGSIHTSISHHDDHLSKKRVKSQLILQQFQSQQLQGPERGGACCGAGWWPPQTWEGRAASIVSVSKSTVPAFKCLDTPDTLYNHMLILSNSETLTKIGHIMECCLLIIKHFESTTIRIQTNRMSY